MTNNDQLSHLVELAMEATKYKGIGETFPVYDEFLEEIFGKDLCVLYEEWIDLHRFEFDADFFIYITTGVMSKSIEDWISNGKNIIKEFWVKSEN